jgi:hypothetical protein
MWFWIFSYFVTQEYFPEISNFHLFKAVLCRVFSYNKQFYV